MNRHKILFIFFALCIVALILRLGTIQVFRSDRVKPDMIDQRFKQIPLYKEKGCILDRNRIPFASSNTESIIVMHYDTYEKNKKLMDGIDNMIYLSLNPVHPVIIRTGEAEGQKIKEATLDESIRFHVRNNNPSMAKHVIGYRSGFNQEGLAGLLEIYDDVLDCDTSVNYAIMQDINGNVIFESEPRVYVKGDRFQPQDLVLTLDIHIQAIAEKYLKSTGKAGCVVVQDCNTGYVLAMCSAPDYQYDYSGLFLQGKKGELVNRTVAEYNPGSIMKLVIAAAILETGNTNDFDYECNGFYRLQGRTVRCTAHTFDNEGPVDLSEGLAVSCNSYFIHAAKKLGYEKVYRKAVQFGLTEETGLASGKMVEGKGYLPEPETVKSDIDLMNLVLGQWVSKVTPMQVCNMTSAIANGGMLNQVNLVYGVVNRNGQKLLDLIDKSGERVLTRTAAKRLSGYMVRCVRLGTGKLSDPHNAIGIGGKTGTAGVEENRNTVWFTGFFPAKNPRYAMTVTLEDSKSGAQDAAPIFGEIAAEIMEIS